jgi:hypothetical protein
MESFMRYLYKRARTRTLVVAVAAFAALVVAGGANAEFPYMNVGPSIKGTPQEGQTLEGLTGLWLYTSGLKCEANANECKYTYSWQRCQADVSGCTDIPGQTGLNYTLTAEDVGRRIRFVEWVFKHDCGEIDYSTGNQECHDVTKNGVSSPTALVEAKPVTVPQVSGTPTVAGLAMEDEMLRATGATWTGPGTITKQFYWQRCNINGEGCVTMDGKVGPTYRILPTDVGSRLRVVETATNEGGSSYAPSAQTNVVAELKPTAARPTIAAARVNLPNRLIVDQIKTTQAGQNVTVRIRVSDTRGFRIVGILVKALPTSLLIGSTAERATDRTGWATFTFRATGSGRTFVYASARKKGERAQSGVSSSNLFPLRIR